MQGLLQRIRKQSNLPLTPKELHFKIKEKNKNHNNFVHKAVEAEGLKIGAGGADDNMLSCKCSRSGCLKGYCECFSKGNFCGEHCKCDNCKNSPEEQTS